MNVTPFCFFFQLFNFILLQFFPHDIYSHQRPTNSTHDLYPRSTTFSYSPESVAIQSSPSFDSESKRIISDCDGLSMKKNPQSSQECVEIISKTFETRQLSSSTSGVICTTINIHIFLQIYFIMVVGAYFKSLTGRFIPSFGSGYQNLDEQVIDKRGRTGSTGRKVDGDVVPESLIYSVPILD